MSGEVQIEQPTRHVAVPDTRVISTLPLPLLVVQVTPSRLQLHWELRHSVSCEAVMGRRHRRSLSDGSLVQPPFNDPGAPARVDRRLCSLLARLEGGRRGRHLEDRKAQQSTARGSNLDPLIEL